LIYHQINLINKDKPDQIIKSFCLLVVATHTLLPRTIMRTSLRCGGQSFRAMFFSFKSCKTWGCKCDSRSSCTTNSLTDPLTPGVYLPSGSCALKPAVAPAPPCKLAKHWHIREVEARQKEE